MELSSSILEVIKSVPKNVNIVAATKYVNAEDTVKLLDLGINNFGENRVDSFLLKYSKLQNQDIHWHFIGHLQRNKAKQVIDKIEYLHSLDSLELAKIINENRTTPLNCFIEININNEESKTGLDFHKINDFIEEVIKYKNINLIGFMCMSKKESSSSEKYRQFKALAYLMNRVNKQYNLNLSQLSMGMSDDYLEAIKAGATYVRLGRILWN